MNAAQFRKAYAAIEKQADQQLTELAAKVRQEVIIPYCDKYKLRFIQGNGTYSIDDSHGNDLETDHSCDYYGQRNVPKHIVEKLEMECRGLSFPLFSYMQNYDGREK